MSASCPASGSPASEPPREPPSPRSATPPCAWRSGCPCSAPSAETPGSRPSTNACEPPENLPNSPSRRRHAEAAPRRLQRRQKPRALRPRHNAAGAGCVVPRQRSRPRLRPTQKTLAQRDGISSDAEGAHCGDERHTRRGSRRGRDIRPPTISPGGVTPPRFATVSEALHT